MLITIKKIHLQLRIPFCDRLNEIMKKAVDAHENESAVKFFNNGALTNPVAKCTADGALTNPVAKCEYGRRRAHKPCGEVRVQQTSWTFRYSHIHNVNNKIYKPEMITCQ